MIDFDEEIKKFQPSFEVSDVEDAIYNNNTADLADILVEMMKQTDEEKNNEML